jgi:hypothetical protein
MPNGRSLGSGRLRLPRHDVKGPDCLSADVRETLGTLARAEPPAVEPQEHVQERSRSDAHGAIGPRYHVELLPGPSPVFTAAMLTTG